MNTITLDKKFTQGWISRQTGTGTTTVSGNVLSCQGSGGDQAMRDFWFPIQAGQIVEVEISARLITGTEVRVAVDQGASNGTDSFGNVDYTATTKKEWTRLKLKVQAPLTYTNRFMKVVLGKWGTQNESYQAEYRDISIKVSDGYGSSSVISQGTLRWLNGVADVHPSHKSFGVKSVSFNSTRKTLVVALEQPMATGFRPLVFLSGTSDQRITPLVGNFTWGVEPSFEVRWSDGVEFIDITNINGLYVNFKVEY